ncbi:hypothetical protein GGF31_005217 [Allomyces arbusculus]|nr:hypothetical protein GGF31_005217 [Allomyces arbusculus]
MDSAFAAHAFLADTFDRLKPVVADVATPTALATAGAVVFATWIGTKLYRMLVPPRHLRKYPHASPIKIIRTLLLRKGFLEQRAILFEAMRDDAIRRGVIKSKEETPSIYLTWFIGRWQVIVVNPTDMKNLLTKHETFEKKRLDAGYMFKFLGNNVALAQTPEWKQQRKVVNPAFRRGWATSLFGTPARQLIKQLDAIAASGAIMDPADWMQRMTLDALTLSAFGTNFDSIKNPNAPMVATYNSLMSEVLDVSKLLNPFYKLSKDGKRARDLIDTFDKYIFDLIDAKTAEIAAKRAAGGAVSDAEDNDSRDLLTLMIEAIQGSDFTREDLRANTITFFVAGHDTTANALSFALYLLGMHPEIQEKARQEVIDVVGDIERGTPAEDVPYPTADQERLLTYLSCVIKEVMRLYPSVTAVPQRFTTAPVTLSDGTSLPVGTLIAGDIYSLHHSKQVWGPDADEFRPDRFLASVGPDGEIPMHPGASNFMWTPFGGGQRICLGQQFSLVEQRVVLSMLLLRYNWTVVGDENALKGHPGTLPGGLLHSAGLQVKLTRRDV